MGDHENSDSPYGTFDQGGNLWEWNEALIDSYRGARGGTWGWREYALRADYRFSYGPADESGGIVFRLAEVPEPAILSLLLFGGLVALRRRR